MISVGQRIVWYAVLAACFAFAIHIFFGSVFAASADNAIQSILARDDYRDGAHHLTGTVFVPSDCHELSVRTTDVTAKVTALVFETWEQPYRQCKDELTPKAFAVVTYAPKNVQFKALLDGSLVPLTVILRSPITQ